MTVPAFRRWVIGSLLCGLFSGLLSCQSSLHMQNAASSPSSQPVSPSSSNVPLAVTPSVGSEIVPSTAQTITTPLSAHARVRGLNVGLMGADAQLITPSVWVRARKVPPSPETFRWVIPGGYMYNNAFCFFPEHGDEDQCYRVEFHDSARYSRTSGRNTQDQHTDQKIIKREGEASLQFGSVGNAKAGGSSTTQVTDLNQEGQQENTAEEYSIERPHLCFSYTGRDNTKESGRYVLVKLRPESEKAHAAVDGYLKGLKPDKPGLVAWLKARVSFPNATQPPAPPVSTPMPSVVALPSIALGKEIWKQYFGVDIGAAPSLPTNIEDILALPCPFSKSQSTVKDTHILVLIPAEINGAAFSLGALQDLLSRNNNVATALRYIPKHQNFGNVTKLSDVLAHRSRWILMTKTSVMQDCKLGATKSEQRKDARLKEASTSLFDALTTRYSVGQRRYDYVVPDFVEAVTAMVLYYGNSRERLCESSSTCQEYIYCTVPSPSTNNHINSDDYVLVGNFHMGGSRNTSTGQQACLEIVEHKKSLIGRLHQRKHNCGVACCIDLNM